MSESWGTYFFVTRRVEKTGSGRWRIGFWPRRCLGYGDGELGLSVCFVILATMLDEVRGFDIVHARWLSSLLNISLSSM